MPDPVLREMLREAERAVEHQIHIAAELDDKTEQMITLGVGLVGAEVTAFAYVASRGVAAKGGIVLVAGILAAFVGLVFLLDAYVGLRRRAFFETGPEIGWVVEKANDETWTEDDHLVAVLRTFPGCIRQNAATIDASSAARKAGLFLLLTSTALAAGGGLYALA